MPMAPESPRVTVILPTYNRAHIIRRTIASILNQTFANFELVVADDCSKDDTEAAVKSFNDPRIRYIRHDRNTGAGGARNTGLKAGRAPYVSFVDSDDEWFPTKLEEQLRVFDTSDLSNLGVVTCGVLVQWGTRRRLAIPSRRGDVRKDLLALRGELVNINMMIKRSLVERELWFDESLRSSEEWDLLIRLAGACRFDYAAKPLVLKHEDGNDRIYSGLAIPRWHAAVIQRYEAEYEDMPNVLARHWGGVGVRYWLEGDPREARRAFRRALGIRRWSPRYAAYYLASFTGGVGSFLLQLARRARYRLMAARPSRGSVAEQQAGPVTQPELR